MSKYEKLGNFLLFEKIEEDKLSKNFLAGNIVNNQIQQFNVLKKFDHSLSTMPDFILDLNQEWEILKSLANPNIVRPSSFIQEKREFAAVFEYVEGKSLRSILNKCQQDGYPFTADHALLVGSRICTALEYLHSKKVNDERLIHGFICPETVFVTYDGEIKLQYLGLSQVLMRFPAGREKLLHDYRNYLAPEALTNNKLDKMADIFSAGLVLLEMLSGEPITPKLRETGVAQAVESAQMFLTSGERVAIADDVKKVVLPALATDPAQRYGSVGDMRKALDQLLFSSDYSPTTFNLAFFMHSLFRESIEEENKSLASFKKVDVATVVKEEPPAPAPRKAEPPVGAVAAKDIGTISLAMPAPTPAEPVMFRGAEEVKEKSKTPLFAGILVGVALLGTIGYFIFKPSTPSNTAQNTAAPTVAQLKADEAERQKLQLEAQKAQEDAKAKDQALKDLQAKLDALMKQQQKQKDTTTKTVDAAQIQQLQEQARKLEEEKKQQQALAQEKLKAAQQQEQPAVSANPPAAEATQQQPAEQKATDQKPADQKPTQMAAANAPAPQPAANPPAQNTTATEKPAPAQAAPAEPKPQPSVKEGDVVELTPDVVRPEPISKVNPEYPLAAQRRKVEGTVIVTALISERGEVSEVRVLRGAGGSAGLNEAAIAAIKKWKFRPAVKEGKRVKVWLNFPIVFKVS
jgi:TonB family protein